MQDVRLIGVDEDGQHVLLAGADGGRFRLPLDEALRAAARRERPRLGQLQIEMDRGLRPRDVQALVRAGASAEEVAERSGWPVEKVHKYEGPILAEREHVAQLARQVRVRGRAGQGGGAAPTLAARVAQRMEGRGVNGEANAWDAWRSPEGGHWTVVLTFAAGGRQRQASWTFDPVSRTVDAADDEARWLSEEEPSGSSVVAGGPAAPARATRVYDVEAEGGVSVTRRTPGQDEPLDLMTAMRQRSTVGGRRTGARRRATPTELPGAEHLPSDALPLDSLSYDAAADAPPPAAHPHPDDDPELVGAPEDEDAGYAAPVALEPPDEVPEVPVPVEVPAVAVADEAASEAPGRDPGPSRKRAAVAEKPPGRRTARASVPSWDDIMFGSRRD